MLSRFVLITLLAPVFSWAQCSFSIQAQGNVLSGTNQLVCYGLETQVYIQNMSGSGPFICALQDTSGQLIQQDTTSSIFYSFDPVVQGTYLITVSDSFSSCIDTIIITQPDSLFASLSIQDQNYCLQDGAIYANPQGGVSPYVMTLSGTITPPFNNLAAGFYSFQLTDGLGCSYNVDSLQLLTVQPLTVSLDTNTMSVSYSGGISPINVLWPNSDTTDALSEILCPGDYEVLIDDASFCAPEVISFSIPEITATIDESLAGVTMVSGGTPPYSYRWNTLDTTALVSALCAGNYSIEITDAGECSQQYSFTIDSLNANFISEEGLVENVEGGTPPYSFFWYTDGDLLAETTNQLIGFCEGYHQVRIQDVQDCSISFFWEVMPIESGLLWNQLNCDQLDFDGDITVNPSGGTAPYITSWNEGGEVLETITPGIQRLLITDNQGCTLKDSVVISELEADCIFNVISPSLKDGINDFWGIKPAFLYSESRVRIYNRWGKIVYDVKGYSDPFDGRDKNKRLLPQGVYYYSILLKEDDRSLQGSLTIY